MIGPAASLGMQTGLVEAPESGVLDLGGWSGEVFPPGAVIYRSSDATDRIYLLKRGRVRLMRQRKTGECSVLSVLRRGDLFGELFGSAASSVEELAVSGAGAEVWSLDGSGFRAQLQGNPNLALHVIRKSAERICELRRRAIALAFKGLPSRLADTLLALADVHGERCEHGGEIDLRGFTQQDFADLAGVSRPSVSVTISRMRHWGALSSCGRILCVRDREALERIASGD